MRVGLSFWEFLATISGVGLLVSLGVTVIQCFSDGSPDGSSTKAFESLGYLWGLFGTGLVISAYFVRKGK